MCKTLFDVDRNPQGLFLKRHDISHRRTLCCRIRYLPPLTWRPPDVCIDGDGVSGYPGGAERDRDPDPHSG